MCYTVLSNIVAYDRIRMVQFLLLMMLYGFGNDDCHHQNYNTKRNCIWHPFFPDGFLGFYTLLMCNFLGLFLFFLLFDSLPCFFL